MEIWVFLDFWHSLVRQELRELRRKCVSRKRAACLMCENGLNARRGWRRLRTMDSGHGLGVCENVLNRNFLAEEPGPPVRPDIPFGQGLAVRLPRGAAGGLSRCPPEHEPQGRVLGQHVRGIFFHNAEAGACREALVGGGAAVGVQCTSRHITTVFAHTEINFQRPNPILLSWMPILCWKNVF